MQLKHEVALGNLVQNARNLVNVGDVLLQAAYGSGNGLRHLPDFVGRLDLHADIQVAVGNFICGALQLFQRIDNADGGHDDECGKDDESHRKNNKDGACHRVVGAEKFRFRQPGRNGPSGVSDGGNVAVIRRTHGGVGQKLRFFRLDCPDDVGRHFGGRDVFIFQRFVREIDHLPLRAGKNVETGAAELVAFHGGVQLVERNVNPYKPGEAVHSGFVNGGDDAHDHFAGDGVLVRFNQHGALLFDGRLVPRAFRKIFTVGLVLVFGNHGVGCTVADPDGREVVRVRFINAPNGVFHSAVAAVCSAALFLRRFSEVLMQQVVRGHLPDDGFVLGKIGVDSIRGRLRFCRQVACGQADNRLPHRLRDENGRNREDHHDWNANPHQNFSHQFFLLHLLFLL